MDLLNELTLGHRLAGRLRETSHTKDVSRNDFALLENLGLR